MSPVEHGRVIGGAVSNNKISERATYYAAVQMGTSRKAKRQKEKNLPFNVWVLPLRQDQSNNNVRILKVIEIEPEPELRQLLRDFDDRGGVLDVAFFRPEGSIDADAIHRSATIQFLDKCATSYFARAASIDYDASPLANSTRTNGTLRP